MIALILATKICKLTESTRTFWTPPAAPLKGSALALHVNVAVKQCSYRNNLWMVKCNCREPRLFIFTMQIQLAVQVKLAMQIQLAVQVLSGG